MNEKLIKNSAQLRPNLHRPEERNSSEKKQVYFHPQNPRKTQGLKQKVYAKCRSEQTGPKTGRLAEYIPKFPVPSNIANEEPEVYFLEQ